LVVVVTVMDFGLAGGFHTFCCSKILYLVG
jgi:hypothetical protein